MANVKAFADEHIDKPKTICPQIHKKCQKVYIKSHVVDTH